MLMANVDDARLRLLEVCLTFVLCTVSICDIVYNLKGLGEWTACVVGYGRIGAGTIYLMEVLACLCACVGNYVHSTV